MVSAEAFDLVQSPDALRADFDRCAAEWKAKSRHLSNGVQKALLVPYQRIIGMGRPVVPLILEDLARDPSHWFWALEAITDENPVPESDRGSVPKSVDAWLAWGRQRNLIR